MGFPKALARLGGQTLLAHTERGLSDAGCREVRIVIGEPHASLIERTHRARYVRNPSPSDGMIGSLRVGLAALLAKTPTEHPLERISIVVALLDQPCVRADTIRRLVEALDSCAARLAVPRYRGRGGHPFVLRADAAAEVLEHMRTERLSAHVRTLRGSLAGVQPRLDFDVDDPFVCSDIDSPEDLARLRAHCAGLK